MHRFEAPEWGYFGYTWFNSKRAPRGVHKPSGHVKHVASSPSTSTVLLPSQLVGLKTRALVAQLDMSTRLLSEGSQVRALPRVFDEASREGSFALLMRWLQVRVLSPGLCPGVAQLAERLWIRLPDLYLIEMRSSFNGRMRGPHPLHAGSNPADRFRRGFLKGILRFGSRRSSVQIRPPFLL